MHSSFCLQECRFEFDTGCYNVQIVERGRKIVEEIKKKTWGD